LHFQLHIADIYGTVVCNIAHSRAAHPVQTKGGPTAPGQHKTVPDQHMMFKIAHSADTSTTTGIPAQASRKVIMIRAATLLALAVILAFSAGQMAASTGSTPPLKAAPAGNVNTAPPKIAPSNVALNFTVADAKGLLLTCAKEQLDTNTFSGCTLAPGRTLDDLMTSIVRAIRAEQDRISVEDK
jgi:hypothetical protein